jgi:glycerol-3-phosphate acyltransferase PlsX
VNGASAVRVAVDAMGGDEGPDEIVAGALEAASETVKPVLYGPKGLDTHGLEFVEASESIEMHEKPVEAVRAKTDSSLVLACRAVGDGEAHAVVSAGHTGATPRRGCSTSAACPRSTDRRSQS